MAKQNKTLIIIIVLLILAVVGFGIYKLVKKEKYNDVPYNRISGLGGISNFSMYPFALKDPPDAQNYIYQYPNGLCKNCEVYENCMKGCHGLTTNCDSICYDRCNK